ncbi:hypothetical protein E6O75_ATG01718 [Venturia nashicola]|uniref:Uncharacterized protein n=1 Tax=Venturia nashicola TaxID=86259 RepID=A0A4Z1NS36_9PEZI|nr:hypothetical protein E6O75_ATG01718 [Venturia nashicola]
MILQFFCRSPMAVTRQPPWKGLQASLAISLAPSTPSVVGNGQNHPGVVGYGQNHPGVVGNGQNHPGVVEYGQNHPGVVENG